MTTGKWGAISLSHAKKEEEKVCVQEKISKKLSSAPGALPAENNTETHQFYKIIP